MKLGGAIIMGNQMEMGKRLLVSDGGLKGTLFRLDDVYEFVYYVPFMAEAMVQLRLLCDVEAQGRFRSFLCKALKYVREDLSGLEAGTDSEGKRVYFCYLFELWQIRRILRELFPETFIIEAIRPEKVCRYLGWENGEEGKRNGGNPNFNRK